MHLRIKTPARLHLGILDITGDLGRIHGSIGVAVEEPNIVVEATPSDELIIPSDEVSSLIKKILSYYNLKEEIDINVIERIPRHVGLGSGTQLSLALATAVTKIHGIETGIQEIAGVTGRGSLSGIGIAAFEQGGFIVDGGHRIDSRVHRIDSRVHRIDSRVHRIDSSREVPPVIFRHPFPKEWGFVIAIPKVERAMYGQEEKEVFKRIIPAPAGISAEICRLLQIKLLPSLIEENIEEFGQAVVEIDRRVGLFFKDVQQGIYREESKQLVEFMLDSGFYGAGQSSWGPAVYGLIREEEGKEKESVMREFMYENNIEGRIILTKANNTGASIGIL